MGLQTESDSKMYTVQRDYVKCIAVLMLSAGASQGCSNIGGDGGDGGDGGLLPGWPVGWDANGQVVRCQRHGAESVPTTGEPEENITCVARESIKVNAELNCLNHGLRDTYLQAICAKTFGGVPSDYIKPEAPQTWKAYLDDYPTEDFEHNPSCDVTHSFSLTDEIPEATDMVYLPTLQYDRCSRESYCATLAAIIDEFPTDGIEMDPWCNISPSGDSESPGPWRCVGSSDDACGYAYLGANLPDPTTICPIVKPNEKDYCVIAVSELDASNKCRDVCDIADGDYLDHYGGVVYPLAGRLACTIFDANMMLWSSDPVAQCDNVDHDPDPTNVVPFTFDADLLISGGAYASFDTDESVGFIAYRIENCVGLVCDIVIEELALSYMAYSGRYYREELDSYPISVDGLSIALLEPVSGRSISTSSTSPAVVTFPSQAFNVRLRAGDLVIGERSVGVVDAHDRLIDQVTGSYDGGVLTLNVAYDTDDATMLLTFTTF